MTKYSLKGIEKIVLKQGNLIYQTGEKEKGFCVQLFEHLKTVYRLEWRRGQLESLSKLTEV